MNITKTTLQGLTELGFSYHFGDDYCNVVEPINGTYISIGFKCLEGSDDVEYIGKTIKATKKETTLEYLLNKIAAESIYKNFSSEFNKLIKSAGFTSYPTTYGIGVFVAFSFRSQVSEAEDKIETLLNSLGIVYTTEYSEARWVFRYKISKAAANINRIQNL